MMGCGTATYATMTSVLNVPHDLIYQWPHLNHLIQQQPIRFLTLTLKALLFKYSIAFQPADYSLKVIRSSSLISMKSASPGTFFILYDRVFRQTVTLRFITQRDLKLDNSNFRVSKQFPCSIFGIEITVSLRLV